MKNGDCGQGVGVEDSANPADADDSVSCFKRNVDVIVGYARCASPCYIIEVPLPSTDDGGDDDNDAAAEQASAGIEQGKGETGGEKSETDESRANVSVSASVLLSRRQADAARIANYFYEIWRRLSGAMGILPRYGAADAAPVFSIPHMYLRMLENVLPCTPETSVLHASDVARGDLLLIMSALVDACQPLAVNLPCAVSFANIYNPSFVAGGLFPQYVAYVEAAFHHLLDRDFIQAQLQRLYVRLYSVMVRLSPLRVTNDNSAYYFATTERYEYLFAPPLGSLVYLVRVGRAACDSSDSVAKWCDAAQDVAYYRRALGGTPADRQAVIMEYLSEYVPIRMTSSSPPAGIASSSYEPTTLSLQVASALYSRWTPFDIAALVYLTERYPRRGNAYYANAFPSMDITRDHIARVGRPGDAAATWTKQDEYGDDILSEWLDIGEQHERLVGDIYTIVDIVAQNLREWNYIVYMALAGKRALVVHNPPNDVESIIGRMFWRAMEAMYNSRASASLPALRAFLYVRGYFRSVRFREDVLRNYILACACRVGITM